MSLRRSLFSVLGVSLLASSAFAIAIAIAIAIPIHSFLMFPRPISKVTSFSFVEQVQYGVGAEGFNYASTSVSGNLRAPISGACIAFNDREQEFTFEEPRAYVGISVADADYTVDEGAQLLIDRL